MRLRIRLITIPLIMESHGLISIRRMTTGIGSHGLISIRRMTTQLKTIPVIGIWSHGLISVKDAARKETVKHLTSYLRLWEHGRGA